MEMDNARVLVADQKIETIKEILPVLEQMTRINQPLLIITEDITGGRQLLRWCAGTLAGVLSSAHSSVEYCEAVQPHHRGRHRCARSRSCCRSVAAGC